MDTVVQIEDLEDQTYQTQWAYLSTLSSEWLVSPWMWPHSTDKVELRHRSPFKVSELVKSHEHPNQRSSNALMQWNHVDSNRERAEPPLITHTIVHKRYQEIDLVLASS